MMKSSDIARALIKLSRETGVEPVKLVAALVEVMKSHRLAGQLPKVAYYLGLELERERRERALSIIVADAVSASTLKHIREYVGAQEGVETIVKIDPKIIGGFIAEYRGRLYDASIVRTVETLRGEVSR